MRPDRELRPGPKSGAQEDDWSAVSTSIVAGADADTLQLATRARRSWAYKLISRAPAPPPSYGSREWRLLSDDDARKLAAVVIAAEAWATDGDNLEERLRLEVEAERQAFKRVEDEEYIARRDEHRERYGNLRLVHNAAWSQTPEFHGGAS